MKIFTNIAGLIASIAFLVAIPFEFNQVERMNEDKYFIQYNQSNSVLKHSATGVSQFNFFALDTFVVKSKGDVQQVRYIQAFFLYAVIEQAFHKVPASVTIAQGLLETGANLQPPGNNHFGIKTQGANFFEWNDDKPREKFAVYNSARQSFRQHSLLLNSDRYKPCLIYRKDLNAFVSCIHSKGYATDPDYSTKLASLIGKYKLWQFDQILEP